MHKIKEIALYVIPEYYLPYEYRGEKYEVNSLSHNLNVLGSIPNDSENLHKKVIRKTTLYSGVSILLSALCAILGIITFSFARYLKLARICIYLIPVLLAVFIITLFIDKMITKRILQNRYDKKRVLLKEFFEEKNIDPSSKKDFLNLFKGGE